MKLRKVGLKLYLYVFYIRTEISCRAFSPQLFTSLEQVVNHLVTRSNSLITSCSNKFDVVSTLLILLIKLITTSSLQLGNATLRV